MSEANPRIILVYDDAQRPETTGGYCKSALAALADVKHVRPDSFQAADFKNADFVLRIDDGQDYELPKELGPAVWWAIDTHLNFDWYAAQAGRYEHVFCAQKNGAERLADLGVSASWLPLACDPSVHRRHDVPIAHELCFIGNLIPGPRAELLERLRQRHPAMLVDRRYFDDMAKAYSASKIAFNRSVRDDVNMRVFEALACGPLLMTNELEENGLPELFRDGVHLATYRDEGDLFEKIDWYLAHDDERQRVAAAGGAEALAAHTYVHRMKRVIEWWNSRPVQSRSTGAKDPTYFEFARPELMALVPATCRSVLDVGCGAGALGAALRQSRRLRVVGVERDPTAAAVAATRLDDVVVGNVEELDPQTISERFDAVVCGDVLEHLRHPEQVLRSLRELLTDGGVVIASIPNARNRTVVGPLIRGNWTYEPAGLLDEDHVRFFTRREIEKLFFRTGYEVERLEFVPGPGYAEWKASGRPDQVRLGPITLEGLPIDEAEEFHVYQYLVVARPLPTRNESLTSIVIVTHNQIGLTRECLASIRHRTDEPYELVVVDNGSTDGTVEYLRSCADVRLVVNDDNRGFPAAANQGINEAKGEYVLLLNNDTVVTTGWIRRMLDAFAADPKLGMVGPCSNYVGSEQQIPVAYSELEDLDGFAWDSAKSHRGRVDPMDRLVGFCLLARREVVDRIGLLDERFGIGNFEDDDWCRRAIEAGWKCGIVRDSFVHHRGHATFDGAQLDLEGLLKRNKRLFEEKWGSSSNASNGIAPKPLPPPRFDFSATKYGLKLVPRVRSSATIIVRNNENTIRACIESVIKHVDEVVVVDTGSTDRTPDICRELGCKVFHHTWPDSFAEARNYALDYAAGEWIFWMDSDDVLPEECGRKLRALVDGPHDQNVLGYVMQVQCPHRTEDGDVDWTNVDHVKLFRNRSDLRWEFRIHEQILPSIRRAGGEVQWTDLYVVHEGSDQTPEGKRRKLERDYRLLELELLDRPNHPFALFNLGMTHHDCGRYEEAVSAFVKAHRAGHVGDSHMRKLYSLWVSSLHSAGRANEAMAVCREGRALYSEDLELRFREASLLHALDRHPEAIEAYRRLMAQQPERYFASMDPGLHLQKARHNLAVALEEIGAFSEAGVEWRQLVEGAPDHRDGWNGRLGHLCRRGPVEEAVEAHRRYLERWPQDAAAWHNYGVSLDLLEDPRGAVSAFQRSLELRPGYELTQRHLDLAKLRREERS